MRCTSISTVQYGQTKRFWTNALCLPWYLLLNGGSIRSSSHHAHNDLTAAGSSFIIPWFLSCFCDATLWMRSSWIAVWLCRSVEALIWKRSRKLRSFSLVKCFVIFSLCWCMNIFSCCVGISIITCSSCNDVKVKDYASTYTSESLFFFIFCLIIFFCRLIIIFL